MRPDPREALRDVLLILVELATDPVATRDTVARIVRISRRLRDAVGDAAWIRAAPPEDIAELGQRDHDRINQRYRCGACGGQGHSRRTCGREPAQRKARRR